MMHLEDFDSDKSLSYSTKSTAKSLEEMKSLCHPFQVEDAVSIRVPVLQQSAAASRQSFVSCAVSELMDCDRINLQLGIRKATALSLPGGGPGDETPTEAAVPPPCPPPTLLAILRRQWAPLLLPAAVLITVVAVTAALAPPPTVVWYLIAYAALFAACTVWLVACHAAQMKHLLCTLVERVPLVFVRPLGEALSPDARVRFVQSHVYHQSHDALHHLSNRDHSADPLAFMRDVIAAKGQDTKTGHCVVDPAGVILWANATLATRLGWPDNSLVGENVRVLMPAPYCAQHDALMRKYCRGMPSSIVGQHRRVPIVDRAGNTSTALLGVEEHADPMDPENYLFLGTLAFSEADQVDPAKTIQDSLSKGKASVAKCCSPLETHPDSLLVINALGIIEWANDSAALLLRYGFGELVGKNVSCLMEDEHARLHDGFLSRYQERAAAGVPKDSPVVGRSRDLYAKTKTGEMVRVYITVKRLDRPSRLARDCLFLGSLLLVKKAKDDLGRRQRSSLRQQSSDGSSVRVTRVAMLSPLAARKCSLVALELARLDLGDVEALHRDLSTFLNLANSQSSRFKAVLHHPVGDRLLVSFNATLMNNAHRSSAGGFLHAVGQQWRLGTQQTRARLYAAGVSGVCVVGQFMSSGVLLSQLPDLSAVLLRLAGEMDAPRPIIDAALYADLQFAFDCRPVNALTFLDDQGQPQDQVLYEMQELKAVEDDEWMYQLEHTQKHDELACWRQSWDSLGLAAGTPDYDHALELLGKHLRQRPTDVVGGWLQGVLRARQAGRAGPTWEALGKLRYMLRYRSDNLPNVRVADPPGGRTRHSLATSAKSE
eukprot:EG_transcript_2310